MKESYNFLSRARTRIKAREYEKMAPQREQEAQTLKEEKNINETLKKDIIPTLQKMEDSFWNTLDEIPTTLVHLMDEIGIAVKKKDRSRDKDGTEYGKSLQKSTIFSTDKTDPHCLKIEHMKGTTWLQKGCLSDAEINKETASSGKIEESEKTIRKKMVKAWQKEKFFISSIKMTYRFGKEYKYRDRRNIGSISLETDGNQIIWRIANWKYGKCEASISEVEKLAETFVQTIDKDRYWNVADPINEDDHWGEDGGAGG